MLRFAHHGLGRCGAQGRFQETGTLCLHFAFSKALAVLCPSLVHSFPGDLKSLKPSSSVQLGCRDKLGLVFIPLQQHPETRPGQCPAFAQLLQEEEPCYQWCSVQGLHNSQGIMTETISVPLITQGMFRKQTPVWWRC